MRREGIIVALAAVIVDLAVPLERARAANRTNARVGEVLRAILDILPLPVGGPGGEVAAKDRGAA